MNANSNKRGFNQPGAVLMTVLTVACFSAILLTAVLTFVNRAHTNAKNNYDSEQAYYIATSAIEGLNTYLQDDSHFADILSFAGKEGTINFTDPDGNEAAMSAFIPNGDCKVKVTEMGDAGETSYIKVSVTGICNGQEETINAYYSVKTGSRSTGIDNALYADGSASFGKSLASAGSLTVRGTYETSNDAVAMGSVITGEDYYSNTQYRWTNDPTDGASYFIVAHNFVVNDNNPSFEPSTPKDDDNTSQYLSIGGAAILQGTIKAFGVQNKDAAGNIASTNEMDIYCSTYMQTGSGAINAMYGNLYVYKNDDYDVIHNDSCNDRGYDFRGNADTYNGSLILKSPNATTINGNVYVEGNIDSTSGQNFTINGALYLASDSNLSITGGGDILCSTLSCESESSMLNWIKGGKLKIMKDSGGYYEASEAGYNAAKADGKIKTIGITHGASGSRNTKPATEFEHYERIYETTAQFLDNTPSIKLAYASAASWDMKNYLLADVTNVEYDASGRAMINGTVINDINNYGNNVIGQPFGYEMEGGRITKYIKPKKQHDDFLNKDYYYAVKSGTGCVITEDSFKGATYYQGNFRSNDLQMVRVLIDMNAINSNFVIRIKNAAALDDVQFIIKNGVKRSDGSWEVEPVDYFCYFIYDEDCTADLNISRTSFIDYNTYKYVQLDGRAINLASHDDDIYADESAGYKDTEGRARGVYSLSPVRTYIMVHEGQTIDLGTNPNLSNGEQLLIEAVIYASKATVKSNGRGDTNSYFLFDYESKTVEKYPKNRRAGVLGAVVCDKLTDGSENFAIAYVPPAAGSGVGGGGDPEEGGSITFSHFESR